MYTPNLLLRSSGNHWFSSSPGQPQDLKPRSSQEGWEEGFTCTGPELQKARASVCCSVLPLHPSIWECQYQNAATGRPEQPDPAGKGTSDPDILQAGWCQLLAGENTALGSVVAELQPCCAPEHNRRVQSAAGAGCWLPAGIPWAPPDMSSHTRTAGGGKMPSSSRRDSTGCSQRCS